MNFIIQAGSLFYQILRRMTSFMEIDTNTLYERKTSLKDIFSEKDGFRTWLAIVAVIIVMFIQRQYIAVMSDFMMQKYHINISQTTGLVNASLYGYAVMQIPTGVLVDKIGVRRLCIVSWSITFVATLIMTLTSSYHTALLMRFLIGASTASAVTSVMKVQALWFDAIYFSHLSAAMALISNIGNLLVTLPLSYLISKIGAQNSMWCICLITLFCVLLLFVFVKDKDNAIQQNEFHVTNALKEVLLNPHSWPPMLIIFTFISTSTSLCGFWGIEYLCQTYHLTTVQASKYMIFLSIGFMAGSPLVSLMDKVNKRNNRLNLQIFTGVYLLCWVYIVVFYRGRPPLIMIPLLFCIMGVVLMFHLLPFTVSKEVNKIENSGIATSSVNSMEFFGSSMINSIIGFLILGGLQIHRAIIVYLICATICFGMTFFIYREKGECRQK